MGVEIQKNDRIMGNTKGKQKIRTFLPGVLPTKK